MSRQADADIGVDIRTRLESDDWSSTISRRVLARRKKIIRGRTGAALSLLCAVVLGTYLLLPEGDGRQANIEGMISAQINGTYAAVFNESGTAPSTTEVSFFSDVDSMIDSALARR